MVVSVAGLNKSPPLGTAVSWPSKNTVCGCRRTDDGARRAVGLAEFFGPAVKNIAEFQPHNNASLLKQGTELDATARGNLETSIMSPQELAQIILAWSIYTAGQLLRDAEHQKKVFAADYMNDLIKQTEDTLGVKLLSVISKRYFCGACSATESKRFGAFCCKRLSARSVWGSPAHPACHRGMPG